MAAVSNGSRDSPHSFVKIPLESTLETPAISTIAQGYLAYVAQFWATPFTWRNFGIIWAYIFFNITATITLYYVFRMSKWKPATLDERKQRWGRFGTWLKWAGIWIQVLIMGTVGMVFSQEHQSGNTVSLVNWNDYDS
jgi:hypothetical protein